jgi:hypothetical protein
MTLRLRLSDGRRFSIEMIARDAKSFRSAVLDVWQRVPRGEAGALHLHVHTLDPSLGDQWYWVDEQARPRGDAGIYIRRPGFISQDQARLAWAAALRTERVMSSRGRELKALAALVTDLPDLSPR